MMKNLYRLMAIGALMLCVMAANAQCLIWNEENIETAKTDTRYSKLVKTILYKADKYAAAEPLTVTNKKTCRSGNTHNYESLSIYYWPDETKTNGLPYVPKDGAYNPEYKDYDYPTLLELVDHLKYLSVAFRLTGEDKYYDAFCKQIDMWFINKATMMLPNFEYSQLIPGLNNGKGCAAGLVDTYRFNDVLESIRLVDAQKTLGKSRMKALRKWFKKMAKWMITSENGKGGAAFTNNIGTAYDITVYDFSLFCNNAKQATQIMDGFSSRRIDTQIESDGSQPLELKRTRAYTYSIQNLEQYLDLCCIQHAACQTNSESYNLPVRIQQGLSFLAQYMGKQAIFPYKEMGSWSEEEMKLRYELLRARRIAPNNLPLKAIVLNENIPTDIVYLLK